MLRIISGQAKGRKLYSLNSSHIKPTSDMVKESFFNIIRNIIVGASFLDLFSCTGNIGLEAFSRGADMVKMVDLNPKSKGLILKNVESCGFRPYLNKKVFFYHIHAIRALKMFEKKKEKFQIIFIDPPYKDLELYKDVIEKISIAGLLDKDGELIVEHYYKNRLENFYGKLIRYREKSIGKKLLSFYQFS